MEDLTNNNNKAKLSFSNKGFIIHTRNNDKLIKWENIELIFLINSVPLDGEYYNKEFRIYLNTEPIYLKPEKKSYLEKIFPPPNRKYPLVRIDDYYFINFTTFYSEISNHLIKNKISDKIVNEPLKTLKIHLLYDKGSFINDQQINNIKSQAIKINE